MTIRYEFRNGRTVIVCEPDDSPMFEEYKPPVRRTVSTNRKSSAYFRLLAAGFAIGEPVHLVFRNFDGCEYVAYNCWFRCVCGKQEELFVTDDKPVNYKLDVASVIERIGSVSAKHLRDDGYTIADIQRIRQAYV